MHAGLYLEEALLLLYQLEIAKLFDLEKCEVLNEAFDGGKSD